MSLPHRRRLLLAALLVAPAAHAAERPAADPAARFEVTASLAPALASADGRFRVEAEARVVPVRQSADGRFRAKVATATCDPVGDGVFANGFEPL